MEMYVLGSAIMIFLTSEQWFNYSQGGQQTGMVSPRISPEMSVIMYLSVCGWVNTNFFSEEAKKKLQKVIQYLRATCCNLSINDLSIYLSNKHKVYTTQKKMNETVTWSGLKKLGEQVKARHFTSKHIVGDWDCVQLPYRENPVLFAATV